MSIWADPGTQTAVGWQAFAPLIRRSWDRCRLRFAPYTTPPIVRAAPSTFDHLRVAHFDLIAVARPFMEDVYQFVEGSGYVVVLTDNTGCILDLLGDPPALETLASLGIEIGVYWNEAQMGTNAIGLALLEAMPVQVTGTQHFFQAHYPLTCSAAPIHDARGRIVGVLAMAGYQETAHPHTLAVVMAAARAITNQFQTDMYVEEANRRLAEINSIFGAISEGVLSWNNDLVITHINRQAGQILGLSPSAVLGRRITEVLNVPHHLLDAFSSETALRDVEATFEVNGKAIECLVSVQPIFEGHGRVIGCILTLRPIERVRRLVHRLMGARASFTLDGLLGESRAMQQVRRQARVAAKGRAPVLLRGEPGVGKNPLAQAIHNESDRADGPFVVLNCRAIPHELMVSEFLGYEGGAFSGALAEGRPSKFELANGGTLYLEDIDGLSLEMQAALLQTLNTGHVLRLGGTRLIPVDVRLIASTSANLERLVQEGNFRADLYYRFGVFVIDLPPLRERPEDIPLLVNRFLARMSRQIGRDVRITSETLEILCRYNWPGNIRELENLLERLITVDGKSTITAQDLPHAIRVGFSPARPSPPAAPVQPLADLEREAILQAGWACQGHVTRMAEMLGISRTTLWRKMKQMGISPAMFKTPA